MIKPECDLVRLGFIWYPCNFIFNSHDNSTYMHLREMDGVLPMDSLTYLPGISGPSEGTCLICFDRNAVDN